MSTRIRWGILATGNIANTFAQDLALLPDAEIAAVGSRTLDAARAFATRHGIPRAYGSWAELAADPEIDVVYVATPHSAHHEAARLCLEAGKAVLCEKPMTLDLASAQDLVTLAGERGVFLMEAMWMRTIPAIRKIVELVADGAIGEVTAVYADFGIAGPFEPTSRLRDPALGGGALLDLGVYPVTFAQLFLGPPQRIAALASLTPEGVDDNTGIILGYDGGALASLHCGIVGATPCTATIVGETGRIELPTLFFRPDRFTIHRGQQAEVVQVPIRGNGMGYEAEEVMRCLREGLTESPLVPLSSTIEVMRCLDAVRAQIGVRY
ncbi:Gfo/Idh/MocA family oxidoreductase [Rugosimonospora acidiphila]|uniref:Gfo/Idh/MocA family oxidoreductase n=1 Tax=Rugosimonospora acidiphila TaxID=556531 RepID=A0ABP9RH73_9ACTN